MDRKPPQWRSPQDARVQNRSVYGAPDRDVTLASKTGTLCNRCGDCCEVVHPSVTRADLHAIVANPYVVGHARAQAEVVLDLLDRPVSVDRGRVGYTCRHFDAGTRLCGIHDRRPDMCRGYPFYGGDPKPDKFMSERCSFQADLRHQLPIVDVR